MSNLILNYLDFTGTLYIVASTLIINTFLLKKIHYQSLILFDTSNWDFIQSDGDLLPVCRSRVFLMNVSFVIKSCLSLKDSTKASYRNMYCS